LEVPAHVTTPAKRESKQSSLSEDGGIHFNLRGETPDLMPKLMWEIQKAMKKIQA
jgi:hypothetical protein